MLRILAPRGLWTSPAERNSLRAFREAFGNGFGVELDVRDYDRRLVVCHDPPDASAILFNEVLELWAQSGGTPTIAINVKSDGLQTMLAEALASRNVEQYFVFDMSIPDLIGYRRAGLRYFARQSDLEPQPHGIDRASGIWFDGFERDWTDLDCLLTRATGGLAVAIVSPELHGRDHQPYWQKLRAELGNWPTHALSRLWLCTDHPFECRAYFDEAH